MNRNRFLVCLLSLGGLLGAAGASSSAAVQQKRLEEFIAQGNAARRAQKLDGNRAALYAKYPTPEIEFSREQTVRGGAEVTLGVGGRFVEGSLVRVPCEGLEVLSTKVTPKRAEARVRVSPYALPQTCELEVHSPVSLASSSTPVLRVVGGSQWELKLANGLTARLKLQSTPDGAVYGTSEWARQGKSLGTRAVNFDLSSEGVFIGVQRSEEEENAAWAARNEGADPQPAAREFNALLDRIAAECGRASDEQRAACEEKYAPKLEAAQTKMYAELEQVERKASTVSAVCDELRLRASEGKVSGEGRNCGTEAPVEVTGTYKPLASK